MHPGLRTEQQRGAQPRLLLNVSCSVLAKEEGPPTRPLLSPPCRSTSAPVSTKWLAATQRTALGLGGACELGKAPSSRTGRACCAELPASGAASSCEALQGCGICRCARRTFSCHGLCGACKQSAVTGERRAKRVQLCALAGVRPDGAQRFAALATRAPRERRSRFCLKPVAHRCGPCRLAATGMPAACLKWCRLCWALLCLHHTLPWQGEKPESLRHAVVLARASVRTLRACVLVCRRGLDTDRTGVAQLEGCSDAWSGDMVGYRRLPSRHRQPHKGSQEWRLPSSRQPWAASATRSRSRQPTLSSANTYTSAPRSRCRPPPRAPPHAAAQSRPPGPARTVAQGRQAPPAPHSLSRGPGAQPGTRRTWTHVCQQLTPGSGSPHHQRDGEHHGRGRGDLGALVCELEQLHGGARLHGCPRRPALRQRCARARPRHTAGARHNCRSGPRRAAAMQSRKRRSPKPPMWRSGQRVGATHLALCGARAGRRAGAARSGLATLRVGHGHAEAAVTAIMLGDRERERPVEREALELAPDNPV